MSRLKGDVKSRVFQKHGSRCYICGCRIALLRDLIKQPSIKILSVSETEIFYATNGGKTKRVKKGSIDHIIPRSVSKNNKQDNLRPCCRDCNQKKGNSYAKEISVDG